MAVIELVKNSYDADATVCSGALRMLTILDEYTGECHVLRADWALRSVDVLEWAKRSKSTERWNTCAATTAVNRSAA